MQFRDGFYDLGVAGAGTLHFERLLLPQVRGLIKNRQQAGPSNRPRSSCISGFQRPLRRMFRRSFPVTETPWRLGFTTNWTRITYTPSLRIIPLHSAPAWNRPFTQGNRISA